MLQTSHSTRRSYTVEEIFAKLEEPQWLVSVIDQAKISGNAIKKLEKIIRNASADEVTKIIPMFLANVDSDKWWIAQAAINALCFIVNQPDAEQIKTLAEGLLEKLNSAQRETSDNVSEIFITMANRAACANAMIEPILAKLSINSEHLQGIYNAAIPALLTMAKQRGSMQETAMAALLAALNNTPADPEVCLVIRELLGIKPLEHAPVTHAVHSDDLTITLAFCRGIISTAANNNTAPLPETSAPGQTL